MGKGNEKEKAIWFYCKNGFSVIPIRAKDKKPNLPEWKRYLTARPSESQIKQWLADGKFENVAIVLGDVSEGLEVIDIDEPDLLGKIGVKENKIWEDGWLVKTGRGWHIYLKHKGKCGRIEKPVGYNIERRTNGGYVVAPPSIHPNGMQYKFYGKSLTELPELKELNVDEIWDDFKAKVEKIKGLKQEKKNIEVKEKGKKYAKGTPPCVASILTGVKKGMRNEVAFGYASYLRQQGIPLSAIKSVLRNWNQKNKPPLPENELMATVKSVYKGEKYVGCTWWQNHGLCPIDPKECLYAFQENGKEAKENKNQKDRLLDLALKNCNFFHNEHNQSFASIQFANGSVAVYPLRSRDFKNYLSYLLYVDSGYAPNSEVLNSAINTLQAIAIFEGKRYKLNVRVAKNENKIFYDIGSPKWDIIEITKDGWRIIRHEEPIFRRYSHMDAQAVTTSTTIGDFTLLLKYTHLKNSYDEVILLATVASFFIPDIPHPILCLFGEPGSTKSTFSKIIRRIIDPSSQIVNSLPDDREELVQIFAHNYVAMFDNVSTLKNWQSDLFCRAVTGDGFSKRQLYTDDDDVIYSFRRCIIINGVNIPLRNADALDRSVMLDLNPVGEKERKQENKVIEEFEKDLPLIFAGLLNIISRAMKIVEIVRKELNYLPRMADFCVWGEAIARALGYADFEFYEKYIQHVNKKEMIAIEENVLGELIIEFMKDKIEWSGTPTQLYNELEEMAERERVNKKSFPKAPNSLSRKLNEIIGNLRRIGIIIEKTREGEKGLRKIKIRSKEKTVRTVISPEIGRDIPDDTKITDDNNIRGKDVVSKITSVADGSNDSDDVFITSRYLLDLVPAEPLSTTINEIMGKFGYEGNEFDYEQRKDYIIEELKNLAEYGRIKIIDDKFTKFSIPRTREVSE